MNWNKFLTYGDSQQKAFESLCNQLFERYSRRTYKNDLVQFRVINGAGGDGGIEAYGELKSKEIIAVQAKWFMQSLDDSEINQIRNSIQTAKKLRPLIREYIICIPHNVNSLRIGRGNKPTTNHEENKINKLIDEIYATYPNLILTWWFDNELLTEIQQGDNEGVHKYWFDKELFSLDYLSVLFNLQKKGWLNERYISELHGQGVIYKEYQKLCFSNEYRKELLVYIEETINDIVYCLTQIDIFIQTNKTVSGINEQLNDIRTNLGLFHEELQNIKSAVSSGNDMYKLHELEEVGLWPIKMELEKIKPDNLQKNVLPKLISSLDKVHKYNLPEYLKSINSYFRQSIRLILGEPGTGKTHGLSHCVETHLRQNAPSIIIQAKGSPVDNWTEILAKAFQLQEWKMDEIFSALETLAIRNDVQKANFLKLEDEPTNECTKAVICIDGLEEDIENTSKWYARIRECEELVARYPRVRFIFSARRYFYDNEEIPESKIYGDVFLPREGDVAIRDIASKYFDKEYYNIQLSSYSLIRGIDSLLALRLFCEEYQNKAISETDKIITATKDLINLKIDRIEQECKIVLQNRIGNARNPILDSLRVIADFFYRNHEIEHTQLVSLIASVANYLSISDIDLLIDYLANNAFLIKIERIDDSSLLKKKMYYYVISYQSFIEHIISENIYLEIRNGKLKEIPQFLHHRMIQPLDYAPKTLDFYYEIMPNQKIIQDIVTSLFVETGQLIGENEFLITGFDDKQVKIFQLTALSEAPNSLAIKYKPKIDELFYSGYNNLVFLLEHLIMPSSYSSYAVFGAEYLHEKLSSMKSAFERDKLWSGLDRYELNELSKTLKDPEIYSLAYEQTEFGSTILSEWDLHNEKPLVLAWRLSTIDQELRDRLRVSLTEWGIKNPSEFHLLLQKIFNCDDPQIQEDLASITLGIASRVKDIEELKKLATWGIENVFKHIDKYRNVIVRQGFRAIAEKAFQFGVITEEEIELCRPKQMLVISLLPFENNLKLNHGECYPIVHDLAWYVIEKAYNHFLEVSSLEGNRFKNNDCPEAKVLLDKYRLAYKNKGLFAFEWTMAVAIAYIKNLGFTRTTGNHYTDATHGSKSKVFTYEEKYTWLAVHFIQGYLSDYIPVKDWYDNRAFVMDYSQLTDIPNPSESIMDWDKKIEKLTRKKEWLIREALTKELVKGPNLKEAIVNWVREEPSFNLENWLTYDSEDFQLAGENKKWTAIYNHTALNDSNQWCYSYITITAGLVQKKDFPILLKIIKQDSNSLYFLTHLYASHATPRTDTYCNPTDLVWMSWIGEDESTETFYESLSKTRKNIFRTITKVIQNGLDGEKYSMIPSKKVRELIGCYELVDDEFKDSNANVVSFSHKVSDGFYKDNQEILVVDSDILENAINQVNYEIVWFVELFRQRNPLNKNFDENFRSQRVRKYFAWNEDGEKRCYKFWDEQFSNTKR
jgi:hypothetical protein